VGHGITQPTDTPLAITRPVLERLRYTAGLLTIHRKALGCRIVQRRHAVPMAKREPHNPLPRWQQGVAPDHHPAPTPQPQQEPDDDGYLHGDFSVYNADHMRSVRVARHVRNALGDRWTERHTRLAHRYLQMLREGKPLPDISPRSAGSVYKPDTNLRRTYLGLPL
jgi:hypothetical protein